jgi:uncharacterized membrane protein YvlD (DUF360 family)
MSPETRFCRSPPLLSLAYCSPGRLAARLSSPFGGVLAGIAVLFVPAYGKWASHVMSDVPATTLMLCGWLLFLHMRSHSPTRLRSYFLAGMLVAVAALWRPVFAAMVLPFLLLTLASFTVFLKRAVVLLLPIAAAAAATFAYNAATFGSISRNGYKLWASVPVDYPSLMFSAANVGMNLWVVYYTAIPLLAAIALGAYLLQHFLKRRTLTEPNDQVGASLVFLVLTNGPILLFYLFYFFPTDRFHLPLATGIAVLAGALVARLLGPQRTPVSLVVVAGMLALGIFGNLTAPEKVPRRRLAAERIRQFTPPNAMVISAIEPVYLERLAARGTARRIVPLSRNVEYASKLLAWKRPDHPQPPLVDSEGRRAPGLIAAGNSEAVAFVATEQLDAIAAAAASGTPVFLDTSWVHPADTTSLGSFQGRFQFAERAPELYELRAR